MKIPLGIPIMNQQLKFYGLPSGTLGAFIRQIYIRRRTRIGSATGAHTVVDPKGITVRRGTTQSSRRSRWKDHRSHGAVSFSEVRCVGSKSEAVVQVCTV